MRVLLLKNRENLSSFVDMHTTSKIVRAYDQEIPQSQTADTSVAS